MAPTTGSFDQLAVHFDRFAELVGGPLTAYLESLLPPQGDSAVDLGCGTGRHAHMLAQYYREVLAVDLSEPMLELARARRSHPAITYQRRDLRTVRTNNDGHFDLVLSAYALHHIANLDHVLRQIRDLAAPGGRVILIDNVAASHGVPRSWFITEALRILAGDLLRRRRPVREAVELFLLNTDPAWLHHLTSDRFLYPDEFTKRYGLVFPDARFTDLYRARALCWDAPTPSHHAHQ